MKAKGFWATKPKNEQKDGEEKKALKTKLYEVGEY